MVANREINLAFRMPTPAFVATTEGQATDAAAAVPTG
jgi:hypothetical protein